MLSPPVRRRCCVQRSRRRCTGPAVQASHSKTAWLLRFPGATCPHAEHRCDVYAAGICSTRPKALCCKRAASRPQPLRLIARLSPRFWATRTPGLLDGAARRAGHRPHVEGFDPDHVEAPREVGGGLLDPVLAPVRSRGPSASRSPVSSRARRLEPRLARASRCCNTFNRFDSPAGQAWVHAAVRRSTAPPTRQRRGRCPPRCHRPDPRSGRGCGRTRYASGRPDRG